MMPRVMTSINSEIPEYLGKVDFSEIVLDEALTYKFENCYFRIGYCK